MMSRNSRLVKAIISLVCILLVFAISVIVIYNHINARNCDNPYEVFGGSIDYLKDKVKLSHTRRGVENEYIYKARIDSLLELESMPI